MRAARARIGRHFVGVRHDRLAGREPAQRPAPAGAHGLPRRADAGTGPFAEGLLHQPVLARVIGDDGEAPAGASASLNAGSARARPASSSFTAIRTAWNSRAKSGGPARGPSTARMALTRSSLMANGWPVAPADDFTGQPPRPALVAVFGEHARQLGLFGVVQERGGGGALPAHAHVERSTRTESKPALGLVQLPGGDAEVEQDEVGVKRGDGASASGSLYAACRYRIAWSPSRAG